MRSEVCTAAIMQDATLGELHMKVIIALDDSPHSNRLLNDVSRRKWPEHTEFRIVNVLEPICSDCAPELEKASAQVQKKRMQAADQLCQHARQRIEHEIPTSKVHYEIRNGDACCELVSSASEWDADKLLLGAHARSTCPHNVLGSVSRSVSLHAPCHVEVVRESGTNRKAVACH